MLWQGLQRDVQYSVTAAEMVIYSGYWKESPVEKDQRGDVPPPWEGGTGTLARWGITLLLECAPSQTCCPMVLWLFQLHEKDNAGQKEGLFSMSGKGEAQKEQDFTASQKGNVRQVRSTYITGEQLIDRTTLGLQKHLSTCWGTMGSSEGWMVQN